MRLNASATSAAFHRSATSICPGDAAANWCRICHHHHDRVVDIGIERVTMLEEPTSLAPPDPHRPVTRATHFLIEQPVDRARIVVADRSMPADARLGIGTAVSQTGDRQAQLCGAIVVFENQRLQLRAALDHFRKGRPRSQGTSAPPCSTIGGRRPARHCHGSGRASIVPPHATLDDATDERHSARKPLVLYLTPCGRTAPNSANASTPPNPDMQFRRVRRRRQEQLANPRIPPAGNTRAAGPESTIDSGTEVLRRDEARCEYMFHGDHSGTSTNSGGTAGQWS